MGTNADAEGAEQSGAATPRRRRVFLSYTRPEIDHAQRVIRLLEGAGYEVWWDGLLTGGDTYLPTTEAALEGADCIVVLWSETAVESHWVRDEAQRGRERGCLVPLSLDGTMAPLGFRQFQLIDISGWKGKPGTPHAESILAAVAAQCGDASDDSVAVAPHAFEGGGGLSSTRRNAVLGAAGILGLAGLGAWQVGLFGGPSGGSVSMAVLPFANLTGDPEQKWFSDGISGELRGVLARNPRLQVSAPTSSAMGEGDDDFAIARALGVENILRGSVQLADDTVRISAELVQIRDGLLLWSNRFDRTFADVFAVQTEIAEKVALSLIAEIASEDDALLSLDEQSGVGGTENIVAYEAYLRGLAFFDLSAGIDTDRAALAQFDAAIAADPLYAAAYAMRANMLAGVANATSDASEIAALYDQSIAAAERAIEIEPKLAKGHLALGFALNNGRLDRAAAYPHFQSAQQLSPGDADTQRSVAIFYAYGEQQALATEMIDRVLELDPLNARAFRTAGFIGLFARDYDAVIARMERALELNPELASAQFAIGNARFMQADYAAALEAFEAETVPLFSQVGSAITHFKLGNQAAAQQAFDAMTAQYGDAGLYQQAQIHAQWGDFDAAIRELEQALAKSDPGMLFAPNDPLLDPLRGDPRLTRLLSQLSS